MGHPLDYDLVFYRSFSSDLSPGTPSRRKAKLGFFVARGGGAAAFDLAPGIIQTPIPGPTLR